MEPHSEAIRIKAVMLRSAGLTLQQVADQLGLPVSTVSTWCNAESARAQIASTRQAIRASLIESVMTVIPDLTQWMRRLVRDAKEARDVDALSRALNALEKTASSASGELIAKSTGGKLEVVVRIAPMYQAEVIDSPSELAPELAPPPQEARIESRDNLALSPAPKEWGGGVEATGPPEHGPSRVRAVEEP